MADSEDLVILDEWDPTDADTAPTQITGSLKRQGIRAQRREREGEYLERITALQAQVRELESYIAEGISRESALANGVTMDEYTVRRSHYRAIELALAWPYSYHDIRKGLRELGLGAPDAELRTWLKRKVGANVSSGDGK